MEIKRNPGMDIIRTLASFFVVSVHFLLNNGFYTEKVTGTNMFIMVLMRVIFMVCVPLFMMLSGYLLKNKKPEKAYYMKGIKILATYIMASVFCAVYINLFKAEKRNLSGIIGGILDFSIVPYSWYIEMYAGLFLLIPFLNILYNNIGTRKEKNILIISFVLLTSIPGIINVYDVTELDWLRNPSELEAFSKLIPQWWVFLYPVTYYFLGCYLSEYGLKISKTLNVFLIILVAIISSCYCWWRCGGDIFIAGTWCDWGSLLNLLLTVLVFVFFINLDYKKMPLWISKVFKFLSSVSLGIYLVSWIFDDMFYPVLINKVPVMPERLKYYFVIVPLVYVCSLVLSFVAEIAYNTGEKLIKKIKGGIK